MKFKQTITEVLAVLVNCYTQFALKSGGVKANALCAILEGTIVKAQVKSKMKVINAIVASLLFDEALDAVNYETSEVINTADVALKTAKLLKVKSLVVFAVNAIFSAMEAFANAMALDIEFNSKVNFTLANCKANFIGKKGVGLVEIYNDRLAHSFIFLTNRFMIQWESV